MIELIHGDCLDRLKELDDNSVDSVVTDPPYGLSFMGKKWDYDVPSEDIWRECLRVLKPGGHLLAFAGTRTQHRMAVRIEDAGFEIRDMIAWIYGSGFPKSHNIGKAVDKLQGNARQVLDTIPDRWAGKGQVLQRSTQQERGDVSVTKGTSPHEGWGTALKPALEPITVARKPLVGTVASNVLEWGTGGINVDGCRVGTEESLTRDCLGWASASHEGYLRPSYENAEKQVFGSTTGRFPANLIHDGSEEVLGLFPQANHKTGGPSAHSIGGKGIYGGGKAITPVGYDDQGSAARFFYCAKASKRDRDEGLDSFEAQRHSDRVNDAGVEGDNPRNRTNNARQNFHPTVKPTDLMRYLCRLVTPPGGIVLDPFMGSGSTGKAAKLEGFQFIGIEREAEYVEIAKARIKA